jgi:hypothetical protein
MGFVKQAAAPAATALALSCAPSAYAISTGVPDGERHPAVGMFATGDARVAGCTGFYAGPRAGNRSEGIFLTAGHCGMSLAERAIPASDVWVTFEANVTMDPSTFETTAATWHQASAYALDPVFGAKRSNAHDWAAIVLAQAPAAPALGLPTRGLLDELVAEGGLRPGRLFDNVGYGVIPARTGPFSFETASARMLSTSRFQSLTPTRLYLLGNSALGDDIGGSCFGDTGGPKLIHGTSTAVALQSDGDASCRAQGHSQRLDTAAARAFLGQYLVLP